MIHDKDFTTRSTEGPFGTIFINTELRVASTAAVRSIDLAKTSLDIPAMSLEKTKRDILHYVYGDLIHPLHSAIYAAKLVGDTALIDQLSEALNLITRMR